MSYWEQVAVANQRHQERRAMHGKTRRFLHEAVLYGASLALWILTLAPVIVPLMR